MGLIAEWRGAVGWGFGCVFLFVSLGFLGWGMVWDPQIFRLSVESVDGKVGKWVGGYLGIAEIRCYYIAGVVIWPCWLPFVLVSLVYLLWGIWRGCVLLILWISYKSGIKSASFVRRIVWLRLGISHNKGAIRKGQVFVFRHNFLFCSIFSISTVQRLENIWLGQKPVCVEFFRSIWIRGEGYCWDSAEIRAPKAKRVVILLNTLHHSSAGFFHSCLIFLFLGNLIPVFYFVASLSGSSTILAASALLSLGIGVYVQGSCTSHGDIRLELVTMFRTIFSSLNFFYTLLDLISGKQSLKIRFSFETVSWVPFESDLLGSKGMLGTWGWADFLRWRYVEIIQIYLHVWRLLTWNSCYKGSSFIDQRCEAAVERLCASWVKMAGYSWNIVKMFTRMWWALFYFIIRILRRVERIRKFSRSCQYCSVIFWLRMVSWKYDDVGREQTHQLGICTNRYTLDGTTELLKYYVLLTKEGNFCCDPAVWRHNIWVWMIGSGCDNVICYASQMQTFGCRSWGRRKHINAAEFIYWIRQFMYGLNGWYEKQSLSCREARTAGTGCLKFYMREGHYWNIGKIIREWQLQRDFRRDVYRSVYVMAGNYKRIKNILLILNQWKCCWKVGQKNGLKWNYKYRMKGVVSGIVYYAKKCWIVKDMRLWAWFTGIKMWKWYDDWIWLVPVSLYMLNICMIWAVANKNEWGCDDFCWAEFARWVWSGYRGFECGRKLGWGNIFLDNSLGMGCGSLMIGAHIWVMLCWFMNRGINGPDGLDDFGLWQWWKEWAAYFADKYKDWAGYLMKLCQIELNGNMLMKWVSNFGVGIIGLKFFLCEWAEWIMDGIYIIGNCAKIEAWVKERVRWWAKSDVGRMNYGSNLKKMMMCGWAWNVKDVHLLNRLVFRIWSYERGLCWPVGFRYGLGFFRKAHYSFGFWLG
ncbi:hypothetical protein HanXRQr2_Chr16g0778561 [Helianthus annuus]|uniref:Uncharacterized protein n=1 Tax=Helianthus annuus TaxID=4232 RepID=A0A9K3DW37_HELAN|nr:hypothetical protein HanXRQr2_Chr16g0778561 [Helianthus annuus]